MASNDKTQGIQTGLVVKSIAAAAAIDSSKPKNSCIVIAYAKSDAPEDIRFTAIKLPKKGLYVREDFLSAISHAENVKNLSYVDFDGKDKDIYVCRSAEGEVYDFVERDNGSNRYGSGFAEIEASNLVFSTETTQVSIEKAMQIEITYNVNGSEYARDSVQFAIINAYNACLLGKMFSRNEFKLETGSGERVKIEVRAVSGKYVDLSTLYIRPDSNVGDSFVSSYVTEKMNVINGDDMITRAYKLSYRPVFKGYYIERIDREE